MKTRAQINMEAYVRERRTKTRLQVITSKEEAEMYKATAKRFDLSFIQLANILLIQFCDFAYKNPVRAGMLLDAMKGGINIYEKFD